MIGLGSALGIRTDLEWVIPLELALGLASVSWWDVDLVLGLARAENNEKDGIV